MKRLFVAIKATPDPSFIHSFRCLRNQLRYEKIKWVEEHNIHITLKFLGETDESLIPRLCQVFQEVGASVKAFSFQFTGLGIFGSSYQPRVIWVGITPAEDLVACMKLLQKYSEPLGFPPDRQRHVPHLTLGRINMLKDKRLFQETIHAFNTLSSLPIPADQLILYESILHRTGPEYIVIQSFPFKK